jgi:hypothetical protein
MADLNTLIAEKLKLVKKSQDMISTIEKEKRRFSNVENVVFNDTLNELREINSQLDIKNGTNPKTITNKTNTKTMNKTFSLIKAIEARANGRTLDESENEVIENGKQEMRNAGLSYIGDIQIPLESRGVIMAGTNLSGQNFVPVDKIGMIEPIRDALVLVQAGAEFLTGLSGDVSIPSYAGTTAS